MLAEAVVWNTISTYSVHANLWVSSVVVKQGTGGAGYMVEVAAYPSTLSDAPEPMKVGMWAQADQARIRAQMVATALSGAMR